MAYTQFVKKNIEKLRKKVRQAYDGLLSDQEALNLGTLFNVPGAQEGNSGLLKFGQPVRLINIEGEDADSETIEITLQQEVVVLRPTNVPVPGPVIGIVEFGTGSGFAKIEFDIPSPVGAPASNLETGPLSDDRIFIPQKSNAVTLILPASSIRVFARNDALTGFLLDFNGTTLGTAVSRRIPAQVRVHVAYGKANMIRERVYRQLFIAGGSGGAITMPAGGAGSSITIGLPAYAKRVAFPRAPIDQTVQVRFLDYYSTLSAGTGTIDIPPDNYDFIDIPPHTAAIFIANPGTNPAAFTDLSAIFELGF